MRRDRDTKKEVGMRINMCRRPQTHTHTDTHTHTHTYTNKTNIHAFSMVHFFFFFFFTLLQTSKFGADHIQGWLVKHGRGIT